MLWNYLTGYVIIQIEGMGLERFVDRMLARNIEIWNVKRERDGTLTACVSVAGFYALHRLDRAGAGVHIRKKRGALLYLSRMRRRKVLLYGWIAALFVLLWASRRLWVVEVAGCDRVSESAVRQALYQAGAHPGVKRRGLTVDALRKAAEQDPRVAMATVSISGVVVRVDIYEATDAPSVVQADVPAHVCAAKAGVILEVTALCGRALVKPGDVVEPGALLISGLLTRERGVQGEPVYVHARGRVRARVAYTLGATADTAQLALAAAAAKLDAVDKRARIVEKTSRVSRTEDGKVRALIVLLAEEDIAQTIALE